MKARILELVLVATLAGCASQNATRQEDAANASRQSEAATPSSQAPADAEKKHELAGISGDLARLNRSKPTEDDGYRKVVRNGQIQYCLIGTLTGSKMYKTRCLTEAAYQDQRKRNEESVRRLGNRALGPDVTGDSAGAGNETRYQTTGTPP
jgi:hypothetical protein